jgi:FkbH-like protein
MLLRRSDFVAARINWSPKADNIRELAAELDLGLDTFLFIDDSPHEREAMRRLASPVRVLDLPADPAQRPAALRSLWQLWPVRLTEEDSTRTQKYAARLGARAAQVTMSNLTEYLSSLQQELVVEPVSEGSISRIAQMHERTNQFNLTTRRLSQGDLASMMAEPERHLLLQGRVSDRFGDHGVVICATASIAGRRARLISFLMSCRVIGREVEFGFLGAMIEALRGRGVDRIEAQFIATKRNGPAAGFLGKAGLVRDMETDVEGELWVWRPELALAPAACVVKIQS